MHECSGSRFELVGNIVMLSKLFEHSNGFGCSQISRTRIHLKNALFEYSNSNKNHSNIYSNRPIERNYMKWVMVGIGIYHFLPRFPV